jgi:uncharacterized protein (DUF58 family)
MGVREYRQGDPFHRVHWTATAGSGKLLVKQFQPAIARETMVFLDLDRGSYDQRYRHSATELAIVVAASVAHHIAVREGLAVGLSTEAFDPLLDGISRFSLPPRSERAHLMSILEVLARVQVASGVSFTDALRRESVHLAWGATLLVVTGKESELLLDSLLALRQSGFAVTLVLVQARAPSIEFQGRAEMLGISVRSVWREQELEAWQ